MKKEQIHPDATVAEKRQWVSPTVRDWDVTEVTMGGGTILSTDLALYS